MMNRVLSGCRCRIRRNICYPAGAVNRFTSGTIRYGMENLGRQLVLVDWDTGKATLVFPDDIELVSEESTAA